jgi:hypothetical protein
MAPRKKRAPTPKPGEKLWSVYGRVVGTKFLGAFAAATAEEAIEQALASEAAGISLCHHCTKEAGELEIDPDGCDADEEGGS